MPAFSYVFSPASDAGFLRFVRGSLAPRCFFVLFPSLYLGPCFYSAGCYPAFSYVYSPALNAGVLRFVRGSLAPRCFFVLFPAVFRGLSCPFPRGIPWFSFFCSLVSRSPAIFLVVASGWHPDIPPLAVLCPAPSLPEFSSPPLGVLCARVSRAGLSFVY